MGLVKHKKLTKAQYNGLSEKDEDTLYAINENGDFSESNMEDSAELYIGDKKIGEKYSNATTTTDGLMSSEDKVKLDSMANGAGYEANLQWGGKNIVDGYSPIDAAMIPILGANRFNCYPVDKVDIEYSRDAGVTWVDYGATDEEKQALFKEDLNATIRVGGKGATPSVDNMVRITINTASTLYAILKKFVFYVTNNSGGGGCHVTISGRTQQNYENGIDTWVVFADKAKVSGWSGWNVVNTSNIITYGNQKIQYGQLRFTFGLDSLPVSQNIGLIVLKMSAYGQVYTAPNTLAWYGRPFGYNFDGSMVLPKGLEIKGGEIRLANFISAKIHGFKNSVANGIYSSAMGYNSFTGIITGDTTYPYAYITNVTPLQFTIVDDNLYGVSLAKNDSTTYTYNGVDYTVTNPSSSYAASVFLVQDTDNTLLKGTSYPFNICNIVKSSVIIGAGRILAVKNIVDNIWEIIVNQQNNTIQSYTTALSLYLFKKTSNINYNGSYSVASGYSSVASGSSSVASGYSSVASGSSSVASGSYSVASGSYSVASGYSSVASGSYSVASGYSSVASGSYSVASGSYSIASGAYSIASGRNSKASHQDSVVLAAYGISGRNQQCVVGIYNKQDSSAYFVVGNGTSDTARSNAMTVSDTGVVTANTFNGALQGNADTATKVKNALTIKNGSTTDTFDGSAAKTIDITDLQNIGDISNLQTSDKSSIVAAINEVNTKVSNNTGESIVNDSTISPFAGFLPTGTTVIDRSSASTNGEVLYDSDNNRFVWKDLSGTFVQFYANWSTSYLYNTTSDSSASAKFNKLFSYNDAHYMVINGTLQDISNIETLINNKTQESKKYAEDYSDKNLSTAKTHSNNNLTEAKEYTNNAISAKIVYCKNQTAYDEITPIEGVLYVIGEE